MSVKPIRPEDVVAQKAAELPDRVIEVWNRLIAVAWDGRESVVGQDDAIKALGGRGPKDAWLNIEEVFRKAGWTVKYDRPRRDEDFEDYEACFTFTPGGK